MDGESWVTVKTYTLYMSRANFPGRDTTQKYSYHVFEDGFSAHWVRIQLRTGNNNNNVMSLNATVTAYFTYT